MTTSTVILIIVAVVLVLAIAVIAGVVLNRRRRISLSERDDSAAPTEAVKGGGYRAGGGISLSSGGPTTAAPPEHPAGERTEVEGQPGVGDDAAVPRDTERRGIVDVQLPDGGTTTEEPPAQPEAPEKPSEPEQPEAPEKAPEAPAEPEVPVQERVEPVPEPTPAEPGAAEEIEEIEPTAGRLERLRGRLSRSRSTFGQGLLGLLGAGDLDEDSWEEIEDTLLMADLGAATTTEITERLRTEIASRGIRTPEQARALLREVLVDTLGPDMERAVRALPHGDPADGGKPAVVLVVGVNGTGKTTTTGKLARVLVADGRTVLLGAADTFRAAAVEQLATWGHRVGAEVVRGKEGADPASVAFEAVSRGSDTAVDAVLVDTAGRLHTKTGLMDELGKVKRVVEKKAQVDEVLLVLDATTGQNGLTQARVFSEVVDVTGIVLTKLDGTAKGGIVFQVQRELGVPVKLVGLGEGPDDLAPFEPGAFVDALLD
ncbi:signal recognition particle-docking protein FtsY [Saccharopolyspora hirsuta]|uniref:Signal recognition particle receptor FtsY n=1 Tax=Saccharopolyspora hirsuta TaxID=1837 RepID=A0A5M7BZ95_SACHI|nr:signal recognition particle-docking protein FtsY [Saccharopolyspora hirsuta]KAA5832581.1 signal recognition particle-docking protein FtsY [Saccharopolyspora hirsuta]